MIGRNIGEHQSGNSNVLSMRTTIHPPTVQHLTMILGQGSTLNHAHSELLPPIVDLIETCTHLHESLKDASWDREHYQEIVANIRYFCSILIVRMNSTGVEALVDGKDRKHILGLLRHLEDQMPEVDYKNICRNTLKRKDNMWEHATPSIFIVLPSDRESCEDSDPSTHQLRLYFLCEVW